MKILVIPFQKFWKAYARRKRNVEFTLKKGNMVILKNCWGVSIKFGSAGSKGHNKNNS